MTEKQWLYARYAVVALFIIPFIMYILQLNGKVSASAFYLSLIAVSTVNFILAVAWYFKIR